MNFPHNIPKVLMPAFARYSNFKYNWDVMASNFDFLKNIDKKLFNIIEDAEKLYRDGYFEQSIVQVRKFGEIVTRNVLGVRRTTEETFDDMLATLKDILGENPSDKEFIDDLYFIKKHGNLAAHEENEINQTGSIALECLQRAFEASINYAIKNKKANKKIINSIYSIDLLMSGKKEKYSEKYQKAKEEMLKEGAAEIADLAQGKTKEDKVLRADFKNKKRIKKEPSKKASSKKEKKEKPATNKKIDPESILYMSICAILLILLVCIILFVLPL